MSDTVEGDPPILRHKAFDQDSAFQPENLLREARRQQMIPQGEVPAVCILDPDGDILEHLVNSKKAHRNPFWACYHTQLFDFDYEGIKFGIIACAVGSSFAVLLAEQLFVSGCRLLISMTSAGQIVDRGDPPYFVLIEKAIRDEGTSYHYLPPSDYCHINAALRESLSGVFSKLAVPVHNGATWTTDAPFRETDLAIKQARDMGVLAVEMEAAALYAFAEARNKKLVCFAHVTNQMAREEGDFEKGEAKGSRDALQVIAATAKACGSF